MDREGQRYADPEDHNDHGEAKQCGDEGEELVHAVGETGGEFLLAQDLGQGTRCGRHDDCLLGDGRRHARFLGHVNRKVEVIIDERGDCVDRHGVVKGQRLAKRRDDRDLG